MAVTEGRNHYELDADWYGGHVAKYVGQNGSRLMQRYAVEKARIEAFKKGLAVTETQKNDLISLTMTDYESGGQITVECDSNGATQVKICTMFPKCNYVIGWFHPAGLTDELLAVVSKHKNIVEIMVHIQHVNTQILRSMNRLSFDFTNERLQRLKNLRPDIAISTEVIVGYPGETEKEFQELIDYLDLGLFQDIGVASYEPVLRSYIEAFAYLDRLPKMVKKSEARQKYKNIAGVDTESKKPEQFGMVLTEIFEEIVNARDEFAIEKMKKYMYETYTMEFRQFVYKVLEESGLKPAMLQRAKVILY